MPQPAPHTRTRRDANALRKAAAAGGTLRTATRRAFEAQVRGRGRGAEADGEAGYVSEGGRSRRRTGEGGDVGQKPEPLGPRTATRDERDTWGVGEGKVGAGAGAGSGMAGAVSPMAGAGAKRSVAARLMNKLSWGEIHGSGSGGGKTSLLPLLPVPPVLPIHEMSARSGRGGKGRAESCRLVHARLVTTRRKPLHPRHPPHPHLHPSPPFPFPPHPPPPPTPQPQPQRSIHCLFVRAPPRPERRAPLGLGLGANGANRGARDVAGADNAEKLAVLARLLAEGDGAGAGVGAAVTGTGAHDTAAARSPRMAPRPAPFPAQPACGHGRSHGASLCRLSPPACAHAHAHFPDSAARPLPLPLPLPRRYADVPRSVRSTYSQHMRREERERGRGGGAVVQGRETARRVRVLGERCCSRGVRRRVRGKGDSEAAAYGGCDDEEAEEDDDGTGTGVGLGRRASVMDAVRSGRARARLLRSVSVVGGAGMRWEGGSCALGGGRGREGGCARTSRLWRTGAGLEKGAGSDVGVRPRNCLKNTDQEYSERRLFTRPVLEDLGRTVEIMMRLGPYPPDVLRKNEDESRRCKRPWVPAPYTEGPQRYHNRRQMPLEMVPMVPHVLLGASMDGGSASRRRRGKKREYDAGESGSRAGSGSPPRKTQRLDTTPYPATPEEHAQMDQAILRDTEEYGSLVPFPKFAPLLITQIVANADPEHLDQKYIHLKEAQSLLSTDSGFLKELQDAWHVEKFATIRDLEILRPPGASAGRTSSKTALDTSLSTEEQDQASSAAWQTPYVAGAHTSFIKTIDALYSKEDQFNYSNHVALIQSSGCGKSRMLHEASQLIPTVIMNFGASDEGFPKSDGQVREYLVGAKTNQQCENRVASFLTSLFRELSKVSFKSPSELAGYLGYGDAEKLSKRTAFFDGVISEACDIEVRAPLISEVYATKEPYPAAKHSASNTAAA
ncbi:hypothetical protein JB92DRAFT_2830038 [Gautieria morchelliformis]|nr:hypothetical protein JB92DRAFT_2830038 [Gautieria morchelliformis]